MRDIKKIAIANRGEVAVRIISACRELGIKTVLLHSEADIQTRAYRMSDETVCIGPAESAKSYLSIDRNIQGILSSGADAVHPGFGFLSENAEFAQACLDHKIAFIGPWPESIRQLGDKVTAKSLAVEQGLPTLPGYQGELQDIESLIFQCEHIGYPVIVKASAGGGGRGMKVLKDSQQARELIPSAQREAKAAFGSSHVFIEKYLDRAKHIEVQVFGDLTGQVVHLYERECSVQRRHQKVIEESLSPLLSAKVREAITQGAVALARRVNYAGAGTVEFLVQDDNYYFLEMNTRLQVEHPVSELVMGVDLVKAQILSQMGRMALWPQEMLKPRGHSIECRIYAEDPYTPGIPSTGKLAYQYFPEAPGRRFDYGFEAGDEITPHYDSMIAKVIVWDESRPRALMKMITTLQETIFFGVKTNIPFLLSVLQHPEFVDGHMTTHFIQKHFPEGASPEPLTPVEKTFLEKAQATISGTTSVLPSENLETMSSPWQKAWRNL